MDIAREGEEENRARVRRRARYAHARLSPLTAKAREALVASAAIISAQAQGAHQGKPLAKETLDRRPGELHRWVLRRVVRACPLIAD